MHGSKSEDEPNLIPLLDVVFQLIMFFMVTIRFVTVEQLNENVVLPLAQAAKPMEEDRDRERKNKKYVYLNLTKDGKLISNKQSEGGREEKLDTDATLTAYLQVRRDILERDAKGKGISPESLIIFVVLRAHEDATYAAVHRVLKSCEVAGFEYWEMRVVRNR